MGSMTDVFRGGDVLRERPSTRAVIADVVLAAVLASVALVVSLGLGDGSDPLGDTVTLPDNPVLWLLLVSPAWLVAFRRLAPGAALVIGALSQMLLWGNDLPNTYLSMPVLLYSAVYFGTTRTRWAAWIVAGLLSCFTVVGGLVGDAPLYAVPIVCLLSLGACALGVESSGRRASEQAAQAKVENLERTREVDRERALVEERARIARELHDVVAHGLSVIVVQAAAARRILDRDPQGTAGALEQIEQTGRNALGEMRQVLSVIRTEPEESWQPAPGLAALDDLVAELAAAGLAVTVTTNYPVTAGGPASPEGDESVAAIPATVDLTAYRIVQESLTNVLKHGGGDANASVTIDRLPNALDLEIVDDGRGAAAVDGGGHGLQGMQERVEVFGGRFEAGPKPGGGFVVSASLPILTDGGDHRA